VTAGPENRRPLKSRDTGWARSAAAWLAGRGVSPDAVSAGSLVFALIGCAAFVAAGSAHGAARVALLLVAAASVQCRLLCNLLDGMVAVEHGRGSPAGPIWNELPDRIADALFLVGAGYGAARAGLGQPADFCGPGAKPHRMALLTLVTVVAAVAEPTLWPSGWSLAIGLALISLLAAVTLVRRTLRLAARLAVNSGS